MAGGWLLHLRTWTLPSGTCFEAMSVLDQLENNAILNDAWGTFKEFLDGGGAKFDITTLTGINGVRYARRAQGVRMGSGGEDIVARAPPAREADASASVCGRGRHPGRDKGRAMRGAQTPESLAPWAACPVSERAIHGQHP